MPKALEVLAPVIEARIAAADRRPLVIGLCGSQGSGKSTVSRALARDLGAKGYHAEVLSIDDLYLTRAQRQKLASDVHPLLVTRGPPGTHDLPLGLALFDDLRNGRPSHLPRFDKAIDDRRPVAQWQPVDGKPDVILFEGWCVGARPQAPAELALPVNDLERLSDPDGVWRHYVNDALAGGYQDLFAVIDCLILLAAPGFSIVEGWRREQEHALRRTSDTGAGMTDAEVTRFVQLYERLTRHILHEMPDRADWTLHLDAQRGVNRVSALAPLPSDQA